LQAQGEESNGKGLGQPGVQIMVALETKCADLQEQLKEAQVRLLERQAAHEVCAFIVMMLKVCTLQRCVVVACHC